MKPLESDFGRHLITFLSGGVPFSLLAAGALYYLTDPGSSVWLVALFSIPFLIHITAWIFVHFERDNLKNEEQKAAPHSPEAQEIKFKREAIEHFCMFFNVTMLISIALYCMPWIVYSLVYSGHIFVSPIFSYVCLLIILIQFSIIAIVTYIMMEKPRKTYFLMFNILLLKRGLELCPFWRFAHFFAIFMSISFVFGFAFAFHDLDYRKNPRLITIDSKEQHFKNRALYVEKLLSSDDLPQDITDKINKEEPASAPQAEVDGVIPICIYFKPGRSIFIDRDRHEELMRGAGKAVNDSEVRKDLVRENHNFEEMKKLIDKFDVDTEKEIPRVTLIGRADDEQPGKSSHYLSNYDLSEARINIVRNRITDRLHTKNSTWQNIDWIPVPLSNEIQDNLDSVVNSTNKDQKPIKSSCADIEYDPESRRRVVEIYFTKITQDAATLEATHARKYIIEEFEKEKYKVPSLLDYMYFSIYTITTTGYGDIKPATFYSKFLVSVENFFEVFFIVCFLNTLLAIKFKDTKEE